MPHRSSSPANHALAGETPGVYFIGRLATHKYYNMDQVAAQALALCDTLTSRQRPELARPA